eukprot:scaffold6264_cov73-Skeletonema_marinoi.AAC.4
MAAEMNDDSPTNKSNDSSKKSTRSSRRLKSTSSTPTDNGTTTTTNNSEALLLLNGNNTTTLKVKKKRKKRRSSTGEGSETDNDETNNNNTANTTTTAEGGKKEKVKKKKSKQREKQRRSTEESSDDVRDGIKKSYSSNSLLDNDVDFSGGGGMGGEKLRDSLTLSKESKKTGARRKSIDNDERPPISPGRRSAVQFSSSTIKRDSSRIVTQVMGEDGSDDEASGGDANISVRSIGIACSGGSALKKQSKYSGGGGGGRTASKKTSFNMSGDDNNDDEKKDATDTAAKPTRGKFDLRPSFQLNDGTTTIDNGKEQAPPPQQRRQSRKEMFARAATNSSLRNSNNVNPDSKTKFEDTRRGSAPPQFRGLTGPQDDSSSSDDGPGSALRRVNSLNELSQRPAISRRSSCKSFMMDIDDDDDGDIGQSARSSRSGLTKRMNAVRSLTHGHRQEVRRVRMSMDKQIFIPPKNRNKGILSAFGHLLAGRVVDCVLWTYQAGFGKVMLLFLTFYVVNIFFWAGVMYAVDNSTGGRCIHDESFDASAFTSLERYEFAFELSWTTFTTVGYGAIGPAADVPRCYPIRLTTAAIMYSKLMRLLAKAHVTFSSTLCVQFGRGNEGSTVRFGQFNFRASVAPAMAMKSISMEDLLNDSDEDTNKREDPLSTSDEGFPVIEFRMVNDRANHEGSEIWDAQIRGIIQLKKDVNPSNKPNAKATGGESTLDLDKKAYYQFALTPDSHPHFSRIWYARHVLNAESPLLKREIRDMIVQEGGKWDKDFNTASEIRQCLNEFISLRITLSGTSAVSANTVFAEHVYEYEDVVVGWRFANMVYEKEPKRKLLRRLFPFGRGDAAEVKGNCETFTKVDKALIHDIVPQPGDDYEDLAETSTLAQLGGLFKRN